MSDDVVKQTIAELQEIVHCDCAPDYRDRGLHSPRSRRTTMADAPKWIMTSSRPEQDLRRLDCITTGPLFGDAPSPFKPTKYVHHRIYDAETARADRAEAELRRLKTAIAEKGGNEHAPTQWAYDQACEALRKHERRADRAEAKLAKAVELLEEIDGFPRKQIKDTLAEITGGKDE